MPQIPRQFRTPTPQFPPGSTTAVAAQPVTPEPQPVDDGSGFGETGAERVAPAPKARGASVSAAAVSGAGSAGSLANAGTHEKNPFLPRISIRGWNIDPLKLKRDLGIR